MLKKNDSKWLPNKIIKKQKQKQVKVRMQPGTTPAMPDISYYWSENEIRHVSNVVVMFFSDDEDIVLLNQRNKNPRFRILCYRTSWIFYTFVKLFEGTLKIHVDQGFPMTWTEYTVNTVVSEKKNWHLTCRRGLHRLPLPWTWKNQRT